MRWEPDPDHTSSTVSARHMMIATVRGSFRLRSGFLEYDERDPEHAYAEAEIDAASVDTRNPERDAHLRSADFLDVERSPTSAFRSTGDERHAHVVGDHTIRGITRQIALETEYNGTGRNQFGQRVMAFAARTRIDRRDFGMAWNVALEAGGVLLGPHLGLDIEAQAKEAAAPARAPAHAGGRAREA